MKTFLKYIILFLIVFKETKHTGLFLMSLDYFVDARYFPVFEKKF